MFCHSRDQAHKPVRLACRHPVEVEPIELDSEGRQDLPEKGILSERKIIALSIVTLARSTAQNDNPISSLLESSQDQLRVNPAAAGHLDDTKAGRTNLSGPADGIGAFVRAPVAEKPNQAWLKILHLHPGP